MPFTTIKITVDNKCHFSLTNLSIPVFLFGTKRPQAMCIYALHSMHRRHVL